MRIKITQFPNGFHLNPSSPQSDQHQFYIISQACNQDTGLQKLIKSSLKVKCYDPKSNSLNKFFKEMYGDQCGEF